MKNVHYFYFLKDMPHVNTQAKLQTIQMFSTILMMGIAHFVNMIPFYRPRKSQKLLYIYQHTSIRVSSFFKFFLLLKHWRARGPKGFYSSTFAKRLFWQIPKYFDVVKVNRMTKIHLQIEFNVLVMISYLIACYKGPFIHSTLE